MPSELSVHAVQQGPMQFAISDGEHGVTVDYPLPGGDGDLGDDPAAPPARQPGGVQRQLGGRCSGVTASPWSASRSRRAGSGATSTRR